MNVTKQKLNQHLMVSLLFMILALMITPFVHAQDNSRNLSVKTVVTADDSKMTESVKNAALTYARFWNTGEERYAKDALAKNFVDMTPPEGRKPGLPGVLEASTNFRGIVPNLTAEVEHLLVVGNYVTVRYRFKGNFTGTMNGEKGKGQKIDFPAVDIYEVENGKIVKNWHLEDYNTFFSQIK